MKRRPAYNTRDAKIAHCLWRVCYLLLTLLIAASLIFVHILVIFFKEFFLLSKP